jgi:hypothetical protein
MLRSVAYAVVGDALGFDHGCHIFQAPNAAIRRKTVTIIGRVTFVAFSPSLSLETSEGADSLSSIKTSTKHDRTAQKIATATKTK